MNPFYYVYVSDRGSAPEAQIASVLAETLADLGYRTVFPSSGLPEQNRDRLNLVVGPHEFFPRHSGHSERELLNAASVSVTLGLEQPGTPGFDIASHYASVGPMALHISDDGVDALNRRGINAAHLQLGYHPTWDRWGGDLNRTRPTDLLFLGKMTPTAVTSCPRRHRCCGTATRISVCGRTPKQPAPGRTAHWRQPPSWGRWPQAASFSTFTVATVSPSTGPRSWRPSSTAAWS